jgi:hypothetical protein
MANDCQTKAETFVVPLIGFLRLAKRIEDERQEIGANASAVVINYEPRVFQRASDGFRFVLLRGRIWRRSRAD